MLTILKSILVAILMIKHFPHLDMVRILIDIILLSIIIWVDVQSTDNVDKDKDPNSDTDRETQTPLSISKGGI